MTVFNHSLHFSESLYGRDPLSYHKLARNGGFEYYETRAHCCTESDDIIQLDPALKEEYPYAREHYRRVGLRCTDHVVWDLSIEVIRDFPDHDLSVYLFTDAVNAIRPDEHRLAATAQYLNKNSFMLRCHGRAPIPTTTFGNTAGKAADPTHIPLPLYVKGAISATGSSSYRCTTREAVQQAIGLMNGEYQLQADVSPSFLLSVEYDIMPQGTVKHLANTEQIIDGVEYVGTRYPTSYNPEDAAHAMAYQAAEDGIRGKIGFDVAVDAEGRYYVLECNPRWTGALYPMVLARRLGVPEWSTTHMPIRAAHLRDVPLGDLEYDAHRKTGVVLVNWGAVRNHWLEFLLIGSWEAQRMLRAQLMSALS